MKKKTIYLHIGTPKTGTTSIQSFMFDNKEIFKSKGLLYPTYGFDNDSRNLQVLFAEGLGAAFGYFSGFLKMQKNTKKYYRKYFKDFFLQEIMDSDCEKILFSEEQLGEADRFGSTLDAFIDVLHEFGFNVKIIIYLRPIADWVASFWQEACKKKLISIESFVLGSPKSLYTYPALVDRLGKDNVIIKPFERVQFKNGDLIEDFLDIFGLELTDDYNMIGDKNIGMGRNNCELLQIINSLSPVPSTIFKAYCNPSKDDVNIVETFSDDFILKLVEEYRPLFKEFALHNGVENFFVNEFPKCYGKERPVYEKVTFNKEQLAILYESIDLSNRKSNISKQIKRKIKNFLVSTLMKLSLYEPICRMLKTRRIRRMQKQAEKS